MTRTKQFITPFVAGLVLVAAAAVPASGYTSPTAAENQPSVVQSQSDREYSSPNAILGSQSPATGERTSSSSPNAILGGRNVASFAVTPVVASGQGGFDWSDALTGAGAATVALFLASGLVMVSRRRRSPTVAPSA